MHPRTLLALLTCLCAAGFASAQEEAPATLDPEAVARLATAHASSLVRLQRNVDEAADALGWGRYRDDLSLSLSGSLDGNELDSLTTSGSASLRASVDILPRITLSGELTGAVQDPPPERTDSLSGSVGVTVQPLADAKGSDRDRIAYDRAVLALETEARAVAFAAVERLLAAVAASADLELTEADLVLARSRLGNVEALHERERATDDELESARDALRSARQQRDRAVLTADRASWTLAQAIGLEAQAFDLPGWDGLDLAAVVDAIPPPDEIDADAVVDASAAVAGASLDLEAARVELSATHRFTPDLSVGAQVRFPLEPESQRQQSTYSVTLGFTVSPADWDGSARTEAEQNVRFAERDLDSARTNAAYDLRAAVLDLSVAHEELSAEVHDLELAEADVAEAEFRLGRGTITRLDLETTQFARLKAAAVVESARAALVKQWYRIDLGQW